MKSSFLWKDICITLVCEENSTNKAEEDDEVFPTIDLLHKIPPFGCLTCDHRCVTKFILTCTFAPISALWDVWVGGSISSYSSIWDPGLVNAPLHSLHDEIQQNVHSLTDVLPICSTCLKVWDSAWRHTAVRTQYLHLLECNTNLICLPVSNTVSATKREHSDRL